ncbi:hypothetical protein D3C78_1318680 [compost metagenome]
MSSPVLVAPTKGTWALPLRSPSYQMLVRDMTQPGSGGTIPALENTCWPVIGRPTPPSAASTNGLPLTMHSANNRGRTTRGLIMTDSIYCF